MMHRMQIFLITWRALVNYSQIFCVHVHENLSLTVSRYTGNNNSERSVFSNDDQQVMTHHCSSRTEDDEIPSRKTRPLEEMWPTRAHAANFWKKRTHRSRLRYMSKLIPKILDLPIFSVMSWVTRPFPDSHLILQNRT